MEKWHLSNKEYKHYQFRDAHIILPIDDENLLDFWDKIKKAVDILIAPPEKDGIEVR